MHRSLITLVAIAAVVAACSSAGDPAIDTAATVPTSAAESVATDPPQTAATVPSTTSPAQEQTATSDASTTTADAAAPFQTLAYEAIEPGVPFPILMVPMPGTDLAVIGSKAGQLWLFDGSSVADEPYLDINGRVRNDGEQGLLGVAFAPDFAESGRFFVHYTDNDGNTAVAEFQGDETTADRSSGVIVFTADQPAPNHNGGMLEFGPDGHLYLALGDGGRSNDAFGHGQNASTPLGGLLRFDVSTPGVAVAAGDGFDHDALWAIGLRNPWRFAIDAPSGLILIADVGQNGFEEVSAALIADSGHNYGWPITEGLHCFSPSSGCSVDGLTLPVLEVQHGDGETCSITGGYVYRGSQIPELDGHYFFSDFCGGYLRSFPISGEVEVTEWTVDVGRRARVSSFGLDASGELYVLTADGDILRIVAVRG